MSSVKTYISQPDIQCINKAIGDRCDSLTNVYLIVYPDHTEELMCEDCINEIDRNDWRQGTKFFEIGDDVTHFFI
jgi:hypothetical protein